MRRADVHRIHPRQAKRAVNVRVLGELIIAAGPPVLDGELVAVEKVRQLEVVVGRQRGVLANLVLRAERAAVRMTSEQRVTQLRLLVESDPLEVVGASNGQVLLRRGLDAAPYVGNARAHARERNSAQRRQFSRWCLRKGLLSEDQQVRTQLVTARYVLRLVVAVQVAEVPVHLHRTAVGRIEG